MTRRAMIAATVAGALLLAGCSQSDADEFNREFREAQEARETPGPKPTPEPAKVEQTNIPWGRWFVEEIELPDGRVVTCIIKSQSYGDAMSCDWAGLANTPIGRDQ